MHKTIQPVRDLEAIEQELKSSIAGIVSFFSRDEKIIQLAVTFIYLDKNIYIFLPKDDELFDKINFEIKANFTLLKNNKPKKVKQFNSISVYNFLSINITGFIRKIEDQKLADEMIRQYLVKYKKDNIEEADTAGLKKIFIIDTEEIQAFEETGG